VHGHSFRVELFLTADRLDDGQMVYDFGLMKGTVREVLDGFDHAALFWEKEAATYAKAMKENSRRWVQLPVSPTAEQLSRVIFVAVQALLDQTDKVNGDETARVHSVILHETETGYAQCFRADAYDSKMGEIDLKRVVWSPAIKAEWKDPGMWEKLVSGGRFKNAKPAVQIAANYRGKAKSRR
jgi:6-pyruvoyltetrahydropterin/6-carboxytetrahydropterin synthase